MKRHERPYGCTFLTCNKVFGSKNDWKRHENSQHFHLETWRCDQERPEGGTCAKVCYRRQTFYDHLKKEHQGLDDDTIRKRLENCRIGRNCQARFWCGFCDKLIELEKKGLEAWTERFDHIDDHFMGRNGPARRVDDWIPMDGKPKDDPESSHSLSRGSAHEAAPPPDGNPSGDEVPGGDHPESSKRRFASDSLAFGLFSGSPLGFLSLAAAGSLSKAVNMDGGSLEDLKGSRAGSGSDDYNRLKSGELENFETVVYCCQCNEPSNSALVIACSCDHQFCHKCRPEVHTRDNKGLLKSVEASALHILKPRTENHHERKLSNEESKDTVHKQSNAPDNGSREGDPANLGDELEAPAVEDHGEAYDSPTTSKDTYLLAIEREVSGRLHMVASGPVAPESSPIQNDVEHRTSNTNETESPGRELEALPTIDAEWQNSSTLSPSGDTHGIMWNLYDMSSLTLATVVETMRQSPGKLDVGSEKMLRLSSESLFLWGESFQASDLDILANQSCHLREAIFQFLFDISKALIEGLFPRISDFAGHKLQQQVAELKVIVRNGVGWKQDDEDMTQKSEDKEDNDDEEDSEDESPDDADEFVVDMHTSIQCLMDLVPSMEQVLQQQAVRLEFSRCPGEVEYPDGVLV